MRGAPQGAPFLQGCPAADPHPSPERGLAIGRAVAPRLPTPSSGFFRGGRGGRGRYNGRIVLLEAVVVPLLRFVALKLERAAAQPTMNEGVDA